MDCINSHGLMSTESILYNVSIVSQSKVDSESTDLVYISVLLIWVVNSHFLSFDYFYFSLALILVLKN